MKVDNKRGIRIQTRIIVSGILILLQIAFLFYVGYNISNHSGSVYILSMLLGALTVVFILNSPGNPDHKIGWIVFILLLPIFGISVYLLWGGGRILPLIKKRYKRCESHYLPLLSNDEDIIEKLRYHDLPHSRQADFLTKESGYPLFDRSSAEYLSPGEKFLPKLLEELEMAENYIYIEYFIIGEGVMWNKIHNILKQKAAKGVEIKIIFDDFGSIKRQSKGFIKRLKAEGIEVTVFNPINFIMNKFMNNRNHRKIIVIDGKVAFTGGINIGDEYINEVERFGYWLDCAVMIRGNAVHSFLAMFCTMWEFSTGKKIDMKSRMAYAPVFEQGFVLPYCDDPLDENNPAEGLYLKIISTAQKYVYIASPYLIIDNTMMNTIKLAAQSGIDIRIITPHIPDKWYVHPVTQYNYTRLLELGVKIYEYTPGFIHSKLFISDDKVATVGTVNMDYRSFLFHFECGAWICNNNSVLTMRDHFHQILSESEEITLAKWKKRSFLSKLKQAILHIFAPLM